MIQLADKTLNLIRENIEKDQGAAFRQALEKIIPKMEDAYRGESSPFRTHLGASLIGRSCTRELWYGFRWAQKAKFPARVLRLFNRGHLEEARFVAMLEICNFQVWYETPDGGQFRISEYNDHFGSALDSVVQGLPELPKNTPAYGEFKTHNDKSFKKLSKEGVAKAKPEHYVQMQICMKKSNLNYGFYLAVNKNDDDLYGEIITLENTTPKHYLDRAKNIIFTDEAPAKISNDASWFECKFCDKAGICHRNEPIEINCRTCCHSTALEEGGWKCEKHNVMLCKEAQLEGCKDHVYNPHLIGAVEVVGGNSQENYSELLLPSGEVIKQGPNHVTSEKLWELF